ncbi:NAD(P)H-hydrate epimerase [Cryobacterium sp. SO2]|uniref:NAD(P)H-hydrate epimerase n=1 Tax=Cryobacterium sp. SO2 TaxID=1897060 RepID=UPI00223CC945|nr:NAD(P)H-hydrate epimerase [Cryobacterium sp. SO2]WEO78854.1 NAD(P)H-hydrate epimerase [Cryobacterium sp. SO2]
MHTSPVQTYTAAQVREAEAPFLERGVPLMDRAARALANEAAALLTTQRGGVEGARVLVLAGSGNNGADALYAAELLAGEGAVLCILPTSDRLHVGALETALARGADLRPVDELPEVIAGLARAADLILDGIVGTGTTGRPALRGAARRTVAAILPVLSADPSAGPSAEHPPLVVAVDLPSGIGVDDGTVPDPTVLRADLTVTFGGCKTGLVRSPAADFAGRVVVADIGIGEELERIRRRDLA